MSFFRPFSVLAARVYEIFGWNPTQRSLQEPFLTEPTGRPKDSIAIDIPSNPPMCIPPSIQQQPFNFHKTKG